MAHFCCTPGNYVTEDLKKEQSFNERPVETLLRELANMSTTKGSFLTRNFVISVKRVEAACPILYESVNMISPCPFFETI